MRSEKPSLNKPDEKETTSLPVWLRWMRSLPMPMRFWLAKRWREKASNRIKWADELTPELRGEEE